METKRSLLVGVFSLLIGVAIADHASDLEWTIYKKYFNKTYSDSYEEAYRYDVWTTNSRRIAQHNLEADNGQHSFWLKMNHFGDMKTDEINFVMNRLRVENADLENRKSSDAEDYGNFTDTAHKVPDKIDWRKKGYVTKVKYQGHCGACYAFSSTGALEGQHFRKTGKLVSLSEQNLVDCTFNNQYHDHGCHGGLMDHAFKYVINNGGVDTEASYPYTASVGRCRFNRNNIGARATSYKDILPRGNEAKLKEAVGTLGPVSVGIDAHSFWFHFYFSGIYNNVFCSSRRLNHALLVVGYDTDSYGRDYWIVKNSWGSWWGMHGYVHMIRNHGNRCGIASLASIPFV